MQFLVVFTMGYFLKSCSGLSKLYYLVFLIIHRKVILSIPFVNFNNWALSMSNYIWLLWVYCIPRHPLEDAFKNLHP